MPARPRRGLSLLEVVVLLIVVLLLIALLAPAISIGRRSPRRTQCLNNMRNIGLAVQNYASQHGALPPLDDGTHPWPRLILRVLDQPALDREIAAGGWSAKEAPYLQVFTCPQDDDSFQQPGGLSYVVNGGYGFFPVDRKTGMATERGRHSLAQNWDGDGEVSDEDRLVTKATGAFWRPDEAVEPMTLDYIGVGDGTGNTLLVTETLHAGPWLSRDAREIAFVIGRERLTFDRAAGPLAVSKTDLGPFGINAAKDAEGLTPAPSSNHAGSVNVIWADGRGGGMSENIDPLIYVRVMTTAGTLYGERPVEDREIQ